MAKCHYIADSARDPHPLLTKDSGQTWPSGIPPVGMASGLPQHGSSVVTTIIFHG
jgi:hypothetical protein